jgi:hypothetical protein
MRTARNSTAGSFSTSVQCLKARSLSRATETPWPNAATEQRSATAAQASMAFVAWVTRPPRGLARWFTPTTESPIMVVTSTARARSVSKFEPVCVSVASMVLSPSRQAYGVRA